MQTDKLMPAGESLGVALPVVAATSLRTSDERTALVMICAGKLLPFMVSVSDWWYLGLLALPRYEWSETHFSAQGTISCSEFWTGAVLSDLILRISELCVKL